MSEEKTLYHYGSIEFATKGRIERPYLDDIEKMLRWSIQQYCKEYDIPLVDQKEAAIFKIISINVYNQENTRFDTHQKKDNRPLFTCEQCGKGCFFSSLSNKCCNCANFGTKEDRCNKCQKSE